MRYRSLDVFIGESRHKVGLLFQYGAGPDATTRLIPATDYWRDDSAPRLSLAASVDDKARREVFLAQYVFQGFFNGVGDRLPNFFQNLLPEGPLRLHLESLAGLQPNDDFGLLSVCGTDLPGAVYVEPGSIESTDIAAIVTQNQDALEMSVVPTPVPEATSLSGVQPKLSLVEKSGRYVARTKDVEGVHIIAKLPASNYPQLPEVEALSMQLASVAGVNVCDVRLVPMTQMETESPFTLGEGRNFLAVTRFDRQGKVHIHCEDFAQILDVPPSLKYTADRANYATLLNLVMTTPGLGLDSAHELLRRLVVNDMLGNYDGHLKNYGLLYLDGRTPVLSPAYDVVAYSVFVGGRGHALRFTPDSEPRARVTPGTIRALCNAVDGLLETKARAIVKETAMRAFAAWPGLIEASDLLPEQKEKLLAHFLSSPVIASLKRRVGKGAQAGAAPKEKAPDTP
ncbi:type II toxin-antitoxin system HipA family toxin [Comamonas koreensis]|uniref:Type II toxin-antitoxin system HipA family toxin n=1 Tax=Comamonas koreensis TaxID=160825 RepID=A0AAW4Y3B7_9BURK|nr:type II toxin-antitoxin system HipA family toxin [Comamonas koreensis]MCD2167459.1 type II toxin-antitoxin system HipA family toxin [Comamonas koreensis]